MMLLKLKKTISQIRESLWKLTHIQNNKRFRSMLTASANWFYRIYVYIDIIDIQDQTLPQKGANSYITLYSPNILNQHYCDMIIYWH